MQVTLEHLGHFHLVIFEPWLTLAMLIDLPARDPGAAPKLVVLQRLVWEFKSAETLEFGEPGKSSSKYLERTWTVA